MSVKRMALFCVAAAVSVQAHADYQCDVGISWLSGSIDMGGGSYYVPPGEYVPPETDDPEPPVGGEMPTIPTTPPASSGDEDYDGWAVTGRYYFAPVDTSHGPIDLAPFITRSSSVGGQYGRLETDETDLETSFWDADVRLVIASRWVLEAELGGREVDELGADTDIDLYRAAVGYYVGETTEVKVSVDREDADFEDYDRWSVQVNHVTTFENGMTWQARALLGNVTGDHDLWRDVDGTDIEIDMSFYFNSRLGVGAKYSAKDRGDAGDIDAHELWANYFVTDKLSLALSYYSEDHDGRDLESDGIVFAAKYKI
ncbi:MAG: putative porin [Pseudomonadales bacterium]